MYLSLAAVMVLFTGVWAGRLTIELAKTHHVGIDAVDPAHKIHLSVVPRLGVIPVAVSLFTGMLLLAWMTRSHEAQTAFLIVSLLPAILIGLMEDLLQTLGTLVRLVFTMISTAIAWWLLEVRLEHVGVGVIDSALAGSVTFAFFFTVIAAAGVSHAFNIVDGCNGLSGFVSFIAFAAIGIVALQVDDVFIAQTAILSAASMLAFLFWNFPKGRLFLGDGGAYAAGLLVAILSILLVSRNQEVSPWFPLLLVAYPVWETLYSAYRRLVVQRWSPFKPDKLHLHNLIYSRLVKLPDSKDHPLYQVSRSSMTSLYLWVPTVLGATVALMSWRSDVVLQISAFIYVVLYLVSYRAIVTFSAPSQLKANRAPDFAKIRSR